MPSIVADEDTDDRGDERLEGVLGRIGIKEDVVGSTAATLCAEHDRRNSLLRRVSSAWL